MTHKYDYICRRFGMTARYQRRDPLALLFPARCKFFKSVERSGALAPASQSDDLADPAEERRPGKRQRVL
jgi:hypothetical protein